MINGLNPAFKVVGLETWPTGAMVLAVGLLQQPITALDLPVGEACRRISCSWANCR